MNIATHDIRHDTLSKVGEANIATHDGVTIHKARRAIIELHDML